jgi:hypothetical protein
VRKLTKEQLAKKFILAMNQKAFAVMVLLVPAQTEAEMNEPLNVSVIGNWSDHHEQVLLLRKIADQIATSVTVN